MNMMTQFSLVAFCPEQKNVLNKFKFLIKETENKQITIYNRYLNNTIKRKNFKHVKKVLHAEQKMLKIRRMNILTFYKQNIKIKNYKNAIRIKYNSFLEKLFKNNI